ncbi:MAG: thermonuclease family protein [Alphaproteobacteria bacterium]
MHLLRFALLLLFASALHAEPDSVSTPATVADTFDGDTLRLDDDARVRLDGINALEIPHQATEIDRCLPSNRRPDPQGPDCDTTLAVAAKKLLHDLTAERTVLLHINPARRTDRYGRILAQVYAPDDHDGAIWAQEKLLAAGLVYVYPLTGHELDLPRMLEIEKSARKAKRGIWQLPEMQPSPAEQAADHYGHYAFIQGKVMHTAKIKNKIYLNFGADWRSDFTVMIERHDWSNFRNLDLLALKGRTISVRGFLHEDNGPMLRATNPAQLELND